MKTLGYVTLLLFMVSCTSGVFSGKAPGEAPKGAAISNEFLFKGNRNVVSKELKAMGIKADFFVVNKALNIHQASFKGKTPYGKIANALVDKVEYIEQNSIVTSKAIEKKVEWSDDPFFFYQWGLNNIGQSAPWGLPGKYDADMKALEALKKYQGQLQQDTIVAVIDTGVNYKHEDLNANMWVNTKESQKELGVGGQDDDGNGYCDDVHGYDFTSENRLAPHCGKIGDADPMDEGGHGTHCAGSIAAVQNNGIGIAGLNPRAEIMALRALGRRGGTLSDVGRAITYAVENKANIISASLGGKSDSPVLKDIIKYAGDNGILFVAAAGNEGVDMEIKSQRHYPAGFDLDTILTVGASDNRDNIATFSNYGHSVVDVFAPGVGILSLYLKQSYTIMNGTSMAAPYVAGLASLLMSAHPELKKDPVRVKEIIMASVDVKPSLYGKAFSNGRVNVLKAMDHAQGGAIRNPLVWHEESHSVSQIGYNTELVDIRKTIKKAGAKALRLHFNFVELDTQFDSIYIYDKNFRLVGEVKHGSSRDYWSPVVTGDTAIVRFVNSKVEKREFGMAVQMAANQKNECLLSGGKFEGVSINENPLQPVKNYVCKTDNMEYTYEDLQKGVDEKNIYFSWQSEGFTIDKIQYTEQAI